VQEGGHIMTKKSTLDSLDPLFEKVGQLNRLHRILICLGAFVLLAGGFFYFSYLPKIQEIDRLKTEKATLEQNLKVARKKAAQLAEYREKMKKAEEDFKVAKAVLPETREIPSLLTSVSDSAQGAGLDVPLFQPQAEVKKDFYAEIPVNIKVSGSYHNVASFFDNVSRLFRIVNIRDIDMKSGKSDTDLQTSCTAVTYKFVETEEAKEGDSKSTSRRTRR
jgi:type IV pilus assembly protein PilO